MHNSFLQKNSTGSYLSFASCCKYAWYKPIFYYLHEMAAFCYLRADLGSGLDHNFPSRLTDEILQSSSDLLYFTLLLPLTWTKYSKFSNFSPSHSLGQIYSKSNSSSLFTSDKIILRKNSFSSLLFLDKKFPVPIQIYKNTLGPIFLLTWKISFFLPTYSILLPLKSKQCPLRLASVLACANSVDDLRI